MAKPKFLIPKDGETNQSLRQFNVAVPIDLKNWITRAANKLGKTNSEFVREILEWAREAYTQEEE